MDETTQKRLTNFYNQIECRLEEIFNKMDKKEFDELIRLANRQDKIQFGNNIMSSTWSIPKLRQFQSRISISFILVSYPIGVNHFNNFYSLS